MRWMVAALVVGMVWGVVAMGVARGQQQTVASGGINGGAVVGGVGISTEGFLQARETAGSVAAPHAAGASAGEKGEGKVYVSLPGVLAQWKLAREAGREPPAEVRYLKGMTRIEAVFVFPAEAGGTGEGRAGVSAGAKAGDVVIEGPVEGIRADNPLEPVGRETGRPIVQLEDLIVAMRAVGGDEAGGGGGGGRRRDFFGCSMDPPANANQIWTDTLKKYGDGPRPRLVAEMKKALGPQEVKLYGVPEDSRVALAMVAADYRLKRLCLGLEMEGTGIGNALGMDAATARVWFEPSYQPLLVSADGNGYELRGPRLKVLAGAQVFVPGGAGAAQMRFAANMTAKMPDVAGRIDAVADLQNVTDCFMVAALLREDRLAERAGMDWGWVMDAGKYPVAQVPVPRQAETLVQLSGNVVAQGGVAITYKGMTGVERGKAESFASVPVRPVEGWFLMMGGKKGD